MSNNSLIPFQVPQLTKDKFDNWCICMKALLGAHDVWDIVETGYVVLENPATLTQAQKDLFQNIKKKDQKTHISFVEFIMFLSSLQFTGKDS